MKLDSLLCFECNILRIRAAGRNPFAKIGPQLTAAQQNLTRAPQVIANLAAFSGGFSCTFRSYRRHDQWNMDLYARTGVCGLVSRGLRVTWSASVNFPVPWMDSTAWIYGIAWTGCTKLTKTLKRPPSWPHQPSEGIEARRSSSQPIVLWQLAGFRPRAWLWRTATWATWWRAVHGRQNLLMESRRLIGGDWRNPAWSWLLHSQDARHRANATPGPSTIPGHL